jgi:hypothetical protein
MEYKFHDAEYIDGLSGRGLDERAIGRLFDAKK